MPEIRSMTNEDLQAYKHLCSICYVYRDASPAEPLDESALRQHVGVFDDEGRLLSAMIQLDYKAYFEGREVKLLGIGGVVTDPVARRQGYVRRMFEEGLPRLRQAGYVFSALYPFSYAFYRKFGYELCHIRREAGFPVSGIRANLFQGQPVRVLPDSDDYGMRQIRESYQQQRNFSICRTEDMWRDRRRGTPWGDLCHAYVLMDKKTPIAYWIGQAEKTDGAILRIREMGYTCPQGCEAIFSMIRTLHEFDRVIMTVPADLELRYLLQDPYDLEEKNLCGGMIRIMDAERALAMLPAPALPGRAVVEVEDEQIQQNNGLFAVESDGYRLMITRVKQLPVDVKCSINGLSVLITGTQCFEDAAASGHAVLLGKQNERFLSALFSQRKCFLDWFF